MLLNAEQVETYEREGYLEIPELFSEEETAVLRLNLVRFFSLDRLEVPRSESGVPLLAHRLERYSEAFALLLRHPRSTARCDSFGSWLLGKRSSRN